MNDEIIKQITTEIDSAFSLGKAVEIGIPPGEAAPKVFMKWFFVDTTTGEVSGEQMALALLTAAQEPDTGA